MTGAQRGELGPCPGRLVSLGVQGRWLEGFGPKKKGQIVKIEYFFDQDHPNYYFAKALPHGSVDRIDRGGSTTRHPSTWAPWPLGRVSPAATSPRAVPTDRLSC